MAVEITASGTRVEAAPGEEIVIRLTENTTTGYQWTIMDLGRHVELVDDELTETRSNGERVIRLRATDPGLSKVRLELKRPWERTQIERFEVQVDVSAVR
ncbi:protease inhibitor I42 family protein [Lentzea tibetensis]|uniref:Protease inhibitor I42 family protein n=1 Tax=Lentzea tibetensis TaxID=2591470 RepID=A0A563F0W1_9PSEU|nr:protease inhibitor I42 family protein [Lentzea tibetensis]TWP53533.1 protease inhibitor I42 family protein [Lentzea tibetensis]